MNQRTALALKVLAVSVLLGLLGDGLLRVGPWSLNFALWTGALVAAAVALIRWQKLQTEVEGRWLVLPVLLFAGAVAWRDSPTLKALDLLALLLTLSLAGLRLRSGRLLSASLAEYALALAVAALHALFGLPLLLSGDVHWRCVPGGNWLRHGLKVGRGLALALPLILIFGGLFAAADAVFQNIVTDLLDFDLTELWRHIAMTIFWAWLVCGYLRSLLLSKEYTVAAVRRPSFLKLGIVETTIVLGSLNLLFLGFVLVQFRYLFGGAPWVAMTSGLTYAEYARRGFFELVIVAALVLPIWLLADWLLKPERPSDVRIFRALVLIQLILLFAVMASALQRMRLYQSEYGLTELRFYTTIFMGWLALVLLWFAATVLRGQRPRFPLGASVLGLLVIFALHGLNPDAWIVRTNAERAQSGQKFDAAYIDSLSADAVPALVAALPSLTPNDRAALANQLLQRWEKPSQPTWRRWNWGRSAASAVVASNQDQLRKMAGLEEGTQSN